MAVTKDHLVLDDFNIYYTNGLVGDVWHTHSDFDVNNVVWVENEEGHEEKYDCDLETVLAVFATCFTGRVDVTIKDYEDNVLGQSKNLRGYMDIDPGTKQGKSRPGKFDINFIEAGSQVCVFPLFSAWHEWYNGYMTLGQSMQVPQSIGRRHVVVVEGTVEIDSVEYAAPAVVTITDQEEYTVTCVTSDVVATFCIETE